MEIQEKVFEDLDNPMEIELERWEINFKKLMKVYGHLII